MLKNVNFCKTPHFIGTVETKIVILGYISHILASGT